MKRLLTTLVVVVLVAGVGASGVYAYQRLDAPTGSDDESSDDSSTAEPIELTTAEVTTVDLIDEDEVDGRLGYGEQRELRGSGGVITGLPDAGDVLDRGDSAWEVDGHPGPAVMYGDLPQWRPLDRNADDGADVLQLEQNLLALGFGAELTVDEEFDTDTRNAVRDWQESRGFERTGVVALGDIVVLPEPMRISEVASTIGADANGPVLSITSTEQLVTMDVAIDKLDLFSVGDSVIVELPGDRRVDGTVDEIAKTATATESGDVTVEVTVTLAEPEPSLVAAPVSVVVQQTRADNAAVVPIRALIALAEGGYAIEKVTGGSTSLIGVELGEFGDGVVQITSGDLVPGDEVVVAP
jgi:peptidoglycan hydrolase-like protein with peptidoglycan-binding domain